MCDIYIWGSQENRKAVIRNPNKDCGMCGGTVPVSPFDVSENLNIVENNLIG